MSRIVTKRSIVIACLVAASIAVSLALSATIRTAGTTEQASAADATVVSTSGPAGPTVKTPVAFGHSTALRDMAKSVPGAKAPPAYRLGEAEAIIHPTGNNTFLADPVVQSNSGGAPIPPTSAELRRQRHRRELERRRLHRRAAGHERRRRPEPLRAVGEHRLLDLLEDRHAARRPDADQQHLEERAQRRRVQLHRAEPRRPGRAVRPDRRPLADQPVQLPGESR